MAYISTDEVRAIRNTLKEKYKGKFKFSVKKSDNTEVIVTVLSGATDFSDVSKNSFDVNQYHLHMYGVHEELFGSIMQVIKTAPASIEGGRAWFDKSNSMIDYFHTAFYITLRVGSWDKQYVYSK
jgi:hypothetical protein